MQGRLPEHVMALPFKTQRELFWATWRVDMIATSVSAGVGFLWMFGFTGLLALLMVAFDVDIPPALNGVVSFVYVVLTFGGGLSLMWLSSRMAYRRFGLVCPSCRLQLNGYRKKRKLLAHGCCPACGNPMVATPQNSSLDRSDRSGANELEG